MCFWYLHLWKNILESEKEIKGKEQLLYKTNMAGVLMFGEKMLISVYKIIKTKDELYTAGAHIQDLVDP